MLYQITTESPNKYTLTVNGTECQIRTRDLVFKMDIKNITYGQRHLMLHGLSKSKAYRLINGIPNNKIKVKHDISYIYSVNYYGIADREEYADCRKEVAEQILVEKIEDIVQLVNNTKESQIPIKPKLEEQKKWNDNNYERKVWKIGSSTVEFSKKPNPYFRFVKNRNKYYTIFG